MALRVFKNTTEIKVTCYFVLIEESESPTAQTTHPCHTPIVKVHILIVKAVLKMQHVKVFSWKKKNSICSSTFAQTDFGFAAITDPSWIPM